MRCKFCFATFTDLNVVKHNFERSKTIITKLANAGFEKINFAGGEPTLVKELPQLLAHAKSLGMTTTIVSNGSMLSLNSRFNDIAANVDWIALSIDSLNDETNINSGRAINGKTVLTIQFYLDIISRIKKAGIKLKINTVVSKFNNVENMREFISTTQPDRWKILQAMPVEGQNCTNDGLFQITTTEFDEFLNRHTGLIAPSSFVPEYVDDIKGSYVMVSPEGTFFDSSIGKHFYSEPILEVGVTKALSQVHVDFNKFIKRGGIYQWSENQQDYFNITISGGVGSGKSTIGKLLAKRLGFEFTSLGNQVIRRAKEMKMNIDEFQNYCIKHPKEDTEIDNQFSNNCNNNSRQVIDYRLGFKFIDNAFNILLKVSTETAKLRVKSAERSTENWQKIQERELSFHDQFLGNYGIVNFLDASHYDLVIETDYLSPESIVNLIINQIKQ